jgi:cation transport regulator
MPYTSITELPASVRHVLPTKAQHLFLKVFNEAWTKHRDLPIKEREVVCFKIAWAIIKRSFEKNRIGLWQPIKKENKTSQISRVNFF